MGFLCISDTSHFKVGVCAEGVWYDEAIVMVCWQTPAVLASLKAHCQGQGCLIVSLYRKTDRCTVHRLHQILPSQCEQVTGNDRCFLNFCH